MLDRPTERPNSDLDKMPIEDRLTQIELRLGLRKPEPTPPPTHALCVYSGLLLPARFFGVPTTHPKPVSQFFNAYRNATPKDRGPMAIPRSISQETFDKHSARYFPDNKPLGTAAAKEFLITMAEKGLGQPAVQSFSNRR